MYVQMKTIIILIMIGINILSSSTNPSSSKVMEEICSFATVSYTLTTCDEHMYLQTHM